MVILWFRRMLRRLAKIWSYDFEEAHLERYRWLQILGLVLGVLAMGTLFVGSFGLAAPLLSDAMGGEVTFFDGRVGATGAAVAFGALAVAVMIVIGYGLGSAFFGPRRAESIPVAWACALSMLIAVAVGFLIPLTIGGIAILVRGGSGSLIDEGMGVMGMVGGEKTVAFVVDRVPTIAAVPAPFAVATYVLANTLGFYALHRLMHTSRVMWLLFHRPHHVPTTLTGVLAPVTVVGPLLFLILPLDLLVFKILLKLFPSDVSVSIVLVLALFQGAGDLAAHQTPLYDRTWRIRPLRYFFGLVSGGPYHYVHHSSRPEDQAVNLCAGAPFLVWDRVFGSYRAPSDARPRIGLTNDPKIRLNPFLIVFSGYQQLVFEMRMNKSWKTRARILFGSVKYKPPVTRDYLIVGYPDSR